jgi:hypothetical protein
MNRLSCLVGRHTWQTSVEKGNSITSCSVCGTLRRKGGRGSGGGPDHLAAKTKGEAYKTGF